MQIMHYELKKYYSLKKVLPYLILAIMIQVITELGKSFMRYEKAPQRNITWLLLLLFAFPPVKPSYRRHSIQLGFWRQRLHGGDFLIFFRDGYVKCFASFSYFIVKAVEFEQQKLVSCTQLIRWGAISCPQSQIHDTISWLMVLMADDKCISQS